MEFQNFSFKNLLDRQGLAEYHRETFLYCCNVHKSIDTAVSTNIYSLSIYIYQRSGISINIEADDGTVKHNGFLFPLYSDGFVFANKYSAHQTQNKKYEALRHKTIS